VNTSRGVSVRDGSSSPPAGLVLRSCSFSRDAQRLPQPRTDSPAAAAAHCFGKWPCHVLLATGWLAGSSEREGSAFARKRQLQRPSFSFISSHSHSHTSSSSSCCLNSMSVELTGGEYGCSSVAASTHQACSTGRESSCRLVCTPSSADNNNITGLRHSPPHGSRHTARVLPVFARSPHNLLQQHSARNKGASLQASTAHASCLSS
jgi:hypothetical protein